MKHILLLIVFVLPILTGCKKNNNQMLEQNKETLPFDSIYGRWETIRYVDVLEKPDDPFGIKYEVDMDTCNFDAIVYINKYESWFKRRLIDVEVDDGCNSGSTIYHILQDGKVEATEPGYWTQMPSSIEDEHWYPHFEETRIVLNQKSDKGIYLYAIATSNFGPIEVNDTVFVLKKVVNPE